MLQYIPCEKVCDFGNSYSHMPNIYHEAQSLSEQKPETSEVHHQTHIQGSDNRFTKGLPVPANQPHLSSLPVEKQWVIR